MGKKILEEFEVNASDQCRQIIGVGTTYKSNIN